MLFISLHVLVVNPPIMVKSEQTLFKRTNEHETPAYLAIKEHLDKRGTCEFRWNLARHAARIYDQ